MVGVKMKSERGPLNVYEGQVAMCVMLLKVLRLHSGMFYKFRACGLWQPRDKLFSYDQVLLKVTVINVQQESATI